MAGYLIGAIPFSFLIVRFRLHRDIRSLGSHNPGATNVLRVAGTLPAVAALVLDVGKGLAPVLVARHLGATPLVVGATALATVVGHVFPVYLGFRGGKGVATAVGAYAAISVSAALTGALVGLLLIAWKRYVSLGSIVGVGVVPLGVAAIGGEMESILAAGAIATLVTARHAGNISRLRSGTERRLGERVELPE